MRPVDGLGDSKIDRRGVDHVDLIRGRDAALRHDCAVEACGVNQTFWRIVVALAWPSFAVGWILTFFGIMRELSASVLLYSVGSEVLSVVLLKLWTNGAAEQVSVIGLMMMILVVLFRAVQLRFLNRRIGMA